MRFDQAMLVFVRTEHRRAVYTRLLEFLTDYLQDDVGERKEIVDRTCVNPAVGVDAVGEVYEVLVRMREAEGDALTTLGASEQVGGGKLTAKSGGRARKK